MGKCVSDYRITTDTPYFVPNWARYNGTALHYSKDKGGIQSKVWTHKRHLIACRWDLEGVSVVRILEENEQYHNKIRHFNTHLISYMYIPWVRWYILPCHHEDKMGIKRTIAGYRQAIFQLWTNSRWHVRLRSSTPVEIMIDVDGATGGRIKIHPIRSDDRDSGRECVVHQ